MVIVTKSKGLILSSQVSGTGWVWQVLCHGDVGVWVAAVAQSKADEVFHVLATDVKGVETEIHGVIAQEQVRCDQGGGV